MQKEAESSQPKPRILIVDDEKANLKILAELLSEQADVSLAKSGQQAIDKAVKLLPDLILLDIIMPEMDGFETIQRLRQISLLEPVPVIFITGLDTADNERYGLDLGAQDYIRKPFNPAVVKSRIATHLKVIKQNKELRLLSVKLKEADEAKSRFLANMSHEIRTPLTAIIGYAEVLQNGDLSDLTPEQAINIIANSGKHLLNLINDILDISKIEANKLQIEHVPISLPNLIAEICSLVASRADEKQLQFGTEIGYPIPGSIISDPTRIKQILLNLLNNAIKFTEQGRVSLNVKMEGTKLCFSVVDSGIGIDPEQQAKIFSAFEQADVSVTRKFGGTGLGLNISKYLAQRLGGGIILESTPGVGSTFKVTIDANEAIDSRLIATSQEFEHSLQQYTQSEFAANTLHGNVLLADDQKELRLLISMMLRKLGLSVEEVENGQELLAATENGHYDLILCDIHMPVMGGEEAVAQLKRQGNKTPVIALTANAMKHEIEHYIAKGFSEHLSKPIQREDFYKKLAHFLTSANATKTSSETLSCATETKQLAAKLEQHIEALESAFFDKQWEALVAHANHLNTLSQSLSRQDIEVCCQTIIQMAPQVAEDNQQANALATHILNLRELL
ncbi:MAG: response regulator [Aestuariibacter sp.]